MIKVLLVEKDPSLAWLYREELEEAGFEVGVERGLWDAVAACRQESSLKCWSLIWSPWEAIPVIGWHVCAKSIRDRWWC